MSKVSGCRPCYRCDGPNEGKRKGGEELHVRRRWGKRPVIEIYFAYKITSEALKIQFHILSSRKTENKVCLFMMNSLAYPNQIILMQDTNMIGNVSGIIICIFMSRSYDTFDIRKWFAISTNARSEQSCSFNHFVSLLSISIRLHQIKQFGSTFLWYQHAVVLIIKIPHRS